MRDFSILGGEPLNLKPRSHNFCSFVAPSAQVGSAYEWADTKKFVARHFREAWSEETVEGLGSRAENAELSIETQDHLVWKSVLVCIACGFRWACGLKPPKPQLRTFLNAESSIIRSPKNPYTRHVLHNKHLCSDVLGLPPFCCVSSGSQGLLLTALLRSKVRVQSIVVGFGAPARGLRLLIWYLLWPSSLMARPAVWHQSANVNSRILRSTLRRLVTLSMSYAQATSFSRMPVALKKTLKP